MYCISLYCTGEPDKPYSFTVCEWCQYAHYENKQKNYIKVQTFRANTIIFPHAWCHCCHDATTLCYLWALLTPQLTSYPKSISHVQSGSVKESVLSSSVSFSCRVKELTVDPNQVIEGGRPNIHAVNQLDLLDEDWLSISPQRDDLKLLCEQNVSTQGLFFNPKVKYVFLLFIFEQQHLTSSLKYIGRFQGPEGDCCLWKRQKLVVFFFFFYICYKWTVMSTGIQISAMKEKFSVVFSFLATEAMLTLFLCPLLTL